VEAWFLVGFVWDVEVSMNRSEYSIAITLSPTPRRGFSGMMWQVAMFLPPLLSRLNYFASLKRGVQMVCKVNREASSAYLTSALRNYLCWTGLFWSDTLQKYQLSNHIGMGFVFSIVCSRRRLGQGREGPLTAFSGLAPESLR
jgi:hypothetical protein